MVYAQLVKQKQQGRLKTLTQRVCLGAARLAALGIKISTSLVERFNLTLRHALAPLARKSLGFCNDRTQLRRRVTFYHAFYNFARPHQSLRLPLYDRDAPEVARFQPKWQHRTPAMAAGLTDHVWSFRELLTAKFEPIHVSSQYPGQRSSTFAKSRTSGWIGLVLLRRYQFIIKVLADEHQLFTLFV